MNSRLLTYDDCCLLSNICLNSERIFYLLKYRFKSNSIQTSFDFKSFLSDQLSDNTKVSRLLLNFYPIIKNSINNNNDDNILSESSEDEFQEISLPKLPINTVDDDYLNKLAEWEPNKHQPMIESDEEEINNDIPQMNNENPQVDSMNLSIELPKNQVEDLLITFVHHPVKTEPIIYEDNDLNLAQLDGQTDFLSNNKNKNLNKFIPKIKSNHNEENRQIINKNIHSHNTYNQRISTSISEKSVSEHMILAEQKLNSFRKIKINDSYPIQRKIFPVNISKLSKSINSSIEKNTKKIKQLDNHQLRTKKRSSSKSKKKLPMVHNGKTLLDYFKVIKHSSKNVNPPTIKKQTNRIELTKKRPANYFDECIVIDDDDDNIQEIEQQRDSISNNIHTREKLLDHAVHSSLMRIKWLFNLELILLEHISIYHEKNILSLNNSLSYHIDSSFISIIIINFLKIFIIRNSNHEQEEISFIQFGLTSYLRYLLIELPTYNHKNNNDNNNCLQCYQYSLIINILFDLLFDLIEYDLCKKINSKEKYRSSLIEDDYFNRFIQLNKNKINEFFHIKLIIYFIELIEIHRNKCSNKKEFFFYINEKKIFQWIEDFIRHIIYQINNLNNERISICLNVMELCLLFVNEKEYHIKQMALFLAKLCEEYPTYLHLFLFDKNLLIDIRLLLINELIWNKFNIKFISINYIDDFFHHIEMILRPPNEIDDMTLLLIQSLFNTYADLIMKNSTFISSNLSEQITRILHNQLESIYLTLINLSHDSNYYQQIKRTVILFRLLKCKWNRL